MEQSIRFVAFVQTFWSTYSIWDMTKEELEELKNAYEMGIDFVQSGETMSLNNLNAIKIFSVKPDMIETMRAVSKQHQDNCAKYYFHGGSGLSKGTVSGWLIDVTKEYIKGLFGAKSKDIRESAEKPKELYVSEVRIEELKSAIHPDFDLNRLIQMCTELNVMYANSCYLGVVMVSRAVIDHIPPVFGKNTFAEVANNHKAGNQTGSSFKKLMLKLEESQRKLSDMYLHSHIRKAETLPNREGVNFSQEMDCLLGEVARHIRESAK